MNTNSGDNMIGFVFGFQSSKLFHVVTWKRQPQNEWNGKQMKTDQGLIIKVRNRRKVIMICKGKKG